MNMDTQPKKQQYYFHNIKATVFLAFNKSSNINWLQLSGNGYSFYEDINKYRQWSKAIFYPVTVLKNKGPWANFDTQRQKLHINTKGDFKTKLNTFIDLLKNNSLSARVKQIDFKYVEVCTRYLDKYFDEVAAHIKEADKRFYTQLPIDSGDKWLKGETWFSIALKLFIDRSFLNIKTYRFINEFRSKKRAISNTVLPKIEVQIYKPQSLEDAAAEAVPIIKAFQKHIGFTTCSMDNEPDYGLIQHTSLLSHNQKLLHYFEKNKSFIALRFPKEVTQNKLVCKIACFITPEAKTAQQMMEYAHIKRATLQRALRVLTLFLEKRGSHGTGLYYQIDSYFVEQIDTNNKNGLNCITKPLSISNNSI